MTAQHRQPRPEPSPLLGVYRFREKIGGCNAWYAVNWLGHMVDFVVVRDGMSERETVDDLIRRVYGENGPTPQLTLVHDRPASSSPQRSLLARAVRVPQRAAPAPFPAR